MKGETGWDVTVGDGLVSEFRNDRRLDKYVVDRLSHTLLERGPRLPPL